MPSIEISSTHLNGYGLVETKESVLQFTKERVKNGLNYWGGAGEENVNCHGDTWSAQTGMAEHSRNDLTREFLEKNGFSKVPTPKIGDIARFGNGHSATVVDFTEDGRPIIYGRDGHYGIFSGTPEDYSRATPYRLDDDSNSGFFQDPTRDPSKNSNVIEYRNYQSKQTPYGLHPPADTTSWPDSRRPKP